MFAEKNGGSRPGGKREQILLAAVDLFLGNDYYQVSVVDIARRAGVGKGTVYEYFTSKEELFKSCFAHCAAAYLELFERSLAGHSTVRQTMYGILADHLQLIRDNRKKILLLFNERPLGLQELQDWVLARRRELLEGVKELINKGIGQNEIRPGIDPDLAGRIFLSLNYVVIGGMVIIDDIEASEDHIEQILQIFWRGIGASG